MKEEAVDELPREEEVNVEVNYVAPPRLYACKRCHRAFESNNKLHKHIRSNCTNSAEPKPQQDQLLIPAKPEEIITSTAERSKTYGYAFRGWRYATATARLSHDSTNDTVCLDTGCAMSLIDRTFLKEQQPSVKIKTMATPINVRGIGQDKYVCNEYAEVELYLVGPKTARLRREVHIVDELKVKMLVGIDIIGPEGITIDIPRKKAIISSCQNVEIPISITSRSPSRTKAAIRSDTPIVVQPQHHQKVAIKATDLPSDRDLLFEPIAHPDGLAIYAHIVDCHLTEIHVRNDSDKAIAIPAETHLGYVVEYEATECYRVSPDVAPLAAGSRIPAAPAEFKSLLSTTTEIDITKEKRLANGVTIYGITAEATQRLEEVVWKHEEVWKDDDGFAEIPQQDWMEIPLVDNWQELYKPGQAKIYPLGPRDREVVDNAFDKLHQQGRMDWTQGSTPFAYPCFVVWTGEGEARKSRVVVDIRALNRITMPDAYPVPLQADILAAVSGAKFISTLDCSAFFYQWRVKPEHRDRLTVASHRGQETFNVAVMRFYNSPAYVQRRIDNILRDHRNFTRVYVDDIVVFSMTLQDHVDHWNSVLSTLSAKTSSYRERKHSWDTLLLSSLVNESTP